MTFPLSLVPVERVKEALTIGYLPMGAEEELTVEAFSLRKGSITVPRQYGLQLCEELGLEFTDLTSTGHEIAWPKVPEPRDYQIDALQLIAENRDSHYDFLFRARTGWGKTAGSLIIAARSGLTTLVVVDQENLKDQWIASAKKLCGLRDDQIGVIQGKRCDYEGKPLTIAMVQTLSQKTFPQEVYDYFGNVFVDEVHIIGAPTFSRILLQFSATYRMGVSATPKRRDNLQKLLDYNLGRVRVYIADEHEESAVYVAQHDGVYSAYANKAPKIGRFINEITEDASRNLLIAEAAAYLYDTGRDILVLSDRIEHLKELESLSYYLGIPEDELGVYAGYDLTYAYEKDPTPSRHPIGWVKGTEYTPIRLQLISKRVNKKRFDAIAERARIILSTYGKFSKGVDVPRLCGGVDATPRSRSEQEQGRILRKVDGKLKPIWITIKDTNSYRSLFALAKRIDDYLMNNSVVSEWSLEEGKVKCDAKEMRRELYQEVKRLKSLRIATNSVGLNTLLTQEQEIRSAMRPATGITVGRPARSPSATGSSHKANGVKSPPGKWNTPKLSSPSPSPKPLRRSVAPSLPSAAGSKRIVSPARFLKRS